MDTNRILAELRSERDRIDRAISALATVNSTGHPRAGRPPRAAQRPRRRVRMSADGRARIAAAQRARWAKAKQAQSPKPMRKMSQVARRKIAAAQRSRWAKVKAQQRAEKKVA